MAKTAKMMKTVVELKQHLDGVLCENYSYNFEWNIEMTAHFKCADRRYFSIYVFDKDEQLLNVKIYTGIYCPKPYRDAVFRYMNTTNENLCFGAFRLDDVGSVYFHDTFKFNDGPVKRKTFDQWFRKVREILERRVDALDALSHGKEVEEYEEFFPRRPFRKVNERWRNHRPPHWIRTKSRVKGANVARNYYDYDFEEYEDEEDLESREGIEKLSESFQPTFSVWEDLTQEALGEWDDLQKRKENDCKLNIANDLHPDITWEESTEGLDKDTKAWLDGKEENVDKPKEWLGDFEFEKWLEEMNLDDEENE